MPNIGANLELYHMSLLGTMGLLNIKEYMISIIKQPLGTWQCHIICNYM